MTGLGVCNPAAAASSLTWGAPPKLIHAGGRDRHRKIRLSDFWGSPLLAVPGPRHFCELPPANALASRHAAIGQRVSCYGWGAFDGGGVDTSYQPAWQDLT